MSNSTLRNFTIYAIFLRAGVGTPDPGETDSAINENNLVPALSMAGAESFSIEH